MGKYMNLSNTLEQYLNDLSSNSPTPGGGNVAALCGALSSSLGAMVCGLTIGKKKYLEVEAEMIQLKDKLTGFRNKFVELGNNDNKAFDQVMLAFKLPKETESEKEERSKKIEEATLGAAEVPAEVMRACRELIPLIKTIIEKGNRNSLSDAGVAAILIETAAKGAFLNVLINCASLNNQTIANEIKKRAEIQIEEISSSCAHLYESTLKYIQQ